MKKQIKFSAIMGSLLAVLLSVATFGAATFAWFTRGTTATASGFDFTASAASGIQISTDAETWRSTIAAEDFNVTSGPQLGNRITLSGMDPVSTVDDATGGAFTFYSAESGDGNFTLAENTEDYLVFDLYFLNQGAENLTLSLTSTSSVEDDENNDFSTSLSTRVGFVVQGSNSDPVVAVGLNGAVSTYIWEPNSLTRSTSALAGSVNNAKYLYNGIANDNSGTPVDTSRSYLPSGSYTSLVSTANDIAVGDSPVIGTLPGALGGQITKVKVFVWIEGQDLDCNNETSAGTVNITLGFDSGAADTLLEEKSADSITATALTLTGDANYGGVVYNAYVLLTDTQGAGNFLLTYKEFITSGTATHIDADITEITLDESVSAGTYEVVVTAYFTGAISSRTSESVVVS